MASNEISYEVVSRAVRAARPGTPVRQVLDRANESKHVVKVNGKWRIKHDQESGACG
jgi:hypothetical protein